MTRKHTLTAVAAVVAFGGVTLTSSPALAGATFFGLPALPGDSDSIVTAISGDGSTILGVSFGATTERAFRWRLGESITELIPLAVSDTTAAYGLTQDGSVIVGASGPVFGFLQAVRWIGDDAPLILGDLSLQIDGISEGRAISADGGMIVGLADGCPCQSFGQAYAWSAATGMTGLGWLDPGAVYSIANGISANGAVIVGQSENAAGNRVAFIYENGLMVPLGDLPGGLEASRATAVSADGKIVVGSGFSDVDLEAFVWDDEGGMVSLVEVPGMLVGTEALDVSSDGQIIVGHGSTSVVGPTALLWEDGDVRNVQARLEALGVDLHAWTLTSAVAVSDDGMTIAGNGIRNGVPRGWVAFLEPTCPVDLTGSGTIGFEDLTILLGAWGGCAGCPADFDDDGKVGFSDLTFLLSKWGPCE